MPDTCPTMRVVAQDPAEQGPFILINAEDFDPAIHTEFVEPEVEAPAEPVVENAPGADGGEGPTKAEIASALAALGVEFKASAPKAELAALLAEAQAIQAA